MPSYLALLCFVVIVVVVVIIVVWKVRRKTRKNIEGLNPGLAQTKEEGLCMRR